MKKLLASLASNLRTLVPRLGACLFIVMFLFADIWELLPKPVQRALSNVHGAVAFVGMWQSFRVFAPNPRRNNASLYAIVTYAGNSSALWYYPRVERFGFFQGMAKFRYRKFLYEHLTVDRNVLAPDFARYVARQNRKDGKMPSQVTLIVETEPIVAPEVALKAPTSAQSRSWVLFTYKVPADNNL
jgi:hypothetical protein